MPPPTSKSTKSWAALLQREIASKAEGVFTPEHKSFEEIRAELRAAGLPCGISYTHRYLQHLVASGKATATDGTALSPDGRRVRATRYLIRE